MTDRSPVVVRWLVGSATQSLDRDSSDLAPADARRLVERARFHRLGASVHRTAAHLGRPEVASALSADRDVALTGHARALAVVELLIEAFADRVTWVVMKGPVLSVLCYPRPDLRAYGDVDVLVSPAQLGAAMALLEEAGCRTLEQNWNKVRALRLGEVHLMTPHGMLIDLHYSIVHHGRRRDRFTISTSSMLEQREPAHLGTRPAWVLSAEEALAHLCLHTAGSGGDKLMWYSDIHHSVLRRPPNWTRFVQVVRDWHASIPAYFVLSTGVLTLHTPVPISVLDALRPARPLDWAHGIAQRADPLCWRTGRRSLGSAFARSAGRSELSTVTHLVDHLLRRRGRRSPPASSEIAEHSLLFHSADSDSERRAFLLGLTDRGD